MNIYVPGYSVISSSGYCRLINRASYNDNPAKCSKIYVRQQSICKELCTFLNFCAGYTYDSGRNNYCTLYSSNKNVKCPSGFNYRDGDVVETSKDLEGMHNQAPDNTCYGKNSGEMNFRNMGLLYL